MDTLEIFFRILAYIVNILANAPKALETISKMWAGFTKFLQTLGNDEAGETFPSPIVRNTSIVPESGTLQLDEDYPPTLFVRVFDTVNLGGPATGFHVG